MRTVGLLPAALTAALLLLLLSQQTVAGIKWLALAKSRQRFWNQTRHCMAARSDGLLKHQVAVCKQHLELMAVLVHASREAMTVCQQLFRDRRWNCSSVNAAPTYLNDLKGGSREQAYVYALSSASMARAISKACSVGATTKCSCGRTPTEAPPDDFKWGGCGDDLQFGLAFTKMFTDTQWTSKRKKRSKRAKVNVHNLAAGRQVVAESLSTACKCHGVSGSCSIKTCWKSLGDLKAIGLELQRKYAVAVEVTNEKVPNMKGRQLRPVNSRRSFGERDLIYYTKSPDYCLPDNGLGSVGTRGRYCMENFDPLDQCCGDDYVVACSIHVPDPKSCSLPNPICCCSPGGHQTMPCALECKKGYDGSSGCRSMCCGRGYTSEVREIKQRCDCKYYWCCYVKCKTCLEKVEINRCR